MVEDYQNLHKLVFLSRVNNSLKLKDTHTKKALLIFRCKSSETLFGSISVEISFAMPSLVHVKFNGTVVSNFLGLLCTIVFA